MLQKLTLFIEKIQDSERRVKKRWVIGATAFAMIFIIIIWLSILNAVIKPVQNLSVNSAETSNDFLSVMETGVGILTARVLDKIQGLTSVVRNGYSITIEKDNQ